MWCEMCQNDTSYFDIHGIAGTHFFPEMYDLSGSFYLEIKTKKCCYNLFACYIAYIWPTRPHGMYMYITDSPCVCATHCLVYLL